MGNKFKLLVVTGLLAIFMASTSSISAKELWNKDGYAITRGGNSTCAEGVEINVAAERTSAFEDEIPAFRKALASAIAAYSFTCDAVQLVFVKGTVEGVTVYHGQAKKEDSWKLTAQPSPLELEAQKIGTDIKGIFDLPKLKATLDRYNKVSDIDQSFQYFVFLNAAKKMTRKIVEETKGSQLSKLVADSYKKNGKVASIRSVLAPSIKAIGHFLPDKAKDLKAAYENEISQLISAEWNAFLTPLLDGGDNYNDAVKKIAVKTSELPPDGVLAKKLDNRVNTWLLAEISVYRSLLEKGYASDLAEKKKLASLLKKDAFPEAFTLSKKTVKTEAALLIDEANKGLKTLEGDAKTLISAVGQTYADIDEVMQTGFALAGEFKDAGFSESAKTILKTTAKRTDKLIVDGLITLKDELTKTAMTRRTIAAYREQLEIFDKLSADHGGFKNYIAAIEDGIAAGRKRLCAEQARKATKDEKYLETKILTGNGAVSLEKLACMLYGNGHILVQYDPGWLFASAKIEIDQAGSGGKKYALSKVSDGESLYGAQLISGERKKFDEQAWIANIDGLIVHPPSGKPNAVGITECDVLAGDPDDPSKVSSGVVLEKAGSDYDFDRAIDACIAAIEFNPNETRYYYLLARILNFLGSDDEAKNYAAIATQKQYPAALFLAAQMHMMEEGDDAFYDAIDDLKAAAKAEHPAAKKLLAELVPAGMDFYRPLPDPTEAEILSTINTNHCSPKVMGMQTCIVTTGITSKNCFQTSATIFSCELVFRKRCDQSGFGNSLFSSMLKAACLPKNDPQFLNFQKLSKGRWESFEP